MSNLIQYGWGKPQHEFHSGTDLNLSPGRVISIKGFKYNLITEKGELETELSGKLLFENDNASLPKVGDWVSFMDYNTLGYVVDVYPRVNALSRKNPGKKIEAQVLAANIDHAVIVQSLDNNFNLMRLDRYIVQIVNCKIKPIVVLNKADLVENHSYYQEEVNRLKRECDVYFCSTYSGHGIQGIATNVFQPGKTCVLIGSSGVGKSSLLNALMNVDVQETSHVSTANSKGRHTTTSRELFMLPGGALIIDTPGMREFGLTGDDEASEEDEFPALRELSKQCRFSDCKHLRETGCAVTKALQDGTLDPIIYDSYIKLMKEQRRFQISADEKKQQAKQFGKIIKEVKSFRKKYKY